MTTKTPTYASAAAGSVRTAIGERDVARRTKRTRLNQAASLAPRRRNDPLPALALVQRDPAALTAPARNVRGLEPAHVREVANAISALGFAAPVLIDGADVVIDGVVRVEAAKLLALPTIPCILIDALTPAERKLLRLAINRLGEKNSWQLDELKLELEELIIEEMPLEVSGFDPTEIDGILAEVEPPQVEPGPIEPEGGEPVARAGDIFLLGPHRVICGDARDAAVLQRLMRGELARFVFTDQPYNVAIVGNVTGGAHREFAMASGEMTPAAFQAFNVAWIGASLRYLADGGVLATFIDWRGLGSVCTAAEATGLAQLNLIVWSKTNAGMGSLYRSQHELLPLFKKGTSQHVNNVELGRKGRWRSNSWTYPGASSLGSDARRGLSDHPTVKPVTMLADALRDLTNRDEVVLDPFLGSGSTLIAAEQTGRVCRGVEIDPRYVDLIVRRYQEVTGTTAVLDGTGEAFADLARRRSEPQLEASDGNPDTTKHAHAPEITGANRERTRVRERAG